MFLLGASLHLQAQQGNVAENDQVKPLTSAVTDSAIALILTEENKVFAGPLNVEVKGKIHRQKIVYRSPLVKSEKKGLMYEKFRLRRNGTQVHVREFRQHMFDASGKQTVRGKVVRINGEIRAAQLIRTGPFWSIQFSSQIMLIVREQDQVRAWRK